MKQPKDMTKDELIRLFEMCADRDVDVFQTTLDCNARWKSSNEKKSKYFETSWQRTKRAALLDLFERQEAEK